MNLKNLELFAIQKTDLSFGNDAFALPISDNLYSHHQAALIDAIEFADKLCADMVKEENLWWPIDGGPVREWKVEYNDDGAVIFCDGEAAWDIEVFIMTVKE
jgi:hypothetical protein